jgi:tetratricopeptide (TPR) repeat protein
MEEKNINYVIPGVPYFGVHNHKDANSLIGFYGGGDSCSGALSVLEYWNPGQDDFVSSCDGLRDADKERKNTTVIGYDNFIGFFQNKNFEARKEKIALENLGKYINSGSRTPLILFLPISTDQPAEVTYFPARVLIGGDHSQRKLIFHDFWLGNNYEMSYDEFNQLQGRAGDDLRDTYVVIQPKKLTEKISELNSRQLLDYPARTSIMENAAEMFKNYAIGSGGAFSFRLWPTALDYLNKVEKSPNFEEYFPPYFKTILSYQLAQVYFNKNDLEKALSYAQKSVEMNHDLDQPFKDWPGYEADGIRPDTPGTTAGPYVMLGDVYAKKGNLNDALENYKKAFEIWSSSQTLKDTINQIEMQLAAAKEE